MNQKYEKAKFSDVFKYSFGGLGSNLAFFLVMSFLTFFYTDIFRNQLLCGCDLNADIKIY